MKINYKLVTLFIAAFFIRLIYLNQSLWLDEATTASAVKHYSLVEIITKFSPRDFHPPLYYLFMKLWSNIFGYSEIALRMPSVIFSLLTGWVVYLIGGIWAAVFFLFNPLIIYYSQEARMYSMITFFLSLSLYYLLTSLRVNKFKIKNLILFSLFCILSFITFYGSIFLIIAMQLYLLFKKQYKYFFVTCFMFYITCLIISPLLYQQYLNAKQSLAIVLNWSSVLGKANFKNLFLIPIKFSIGRISFEPKWFYWLISGIWSIFISFFVFKGGLKNKLYLCLFLSPVFIAFIFSFFVPLLQYFRFIYLIPIMSILLALGINLRGFFIKSINLGGSFAFILTGGFLFLSLLYLLNPQFHREDWKSLAKSLHKGENIYMIISSSDPLKYYRQDIFIRDLREINNNKITLDKNLLIIPYTSEIHGFDYKNILTNKKYKLKETNNYRGVSVEEWNLINN